MYGLIWHEFWYVEGHAKHASVQNIPLVPGLLPEQSLRASTSPGLIFGAQFF